MKRGKLQVDKIRIGEEDEPVGKSIVAFEIEDTLRQRIRREAFDRDISMSAMIRYVLQQYFRDGGDSEKR